MAAQSDSEDETSAALAIFQSAVYGNDSLILRRMSQTQQQAQINTAESQNPNTQLTQDNVSSASEEDIDQAPEATPEQDEKETGGDDGDCNDSQDQPQNRSRLNWADADDEMKQQFFRMIMQRMEEEHMRKKEEAEDEDPEDLYKVGSIVDLSLPHSKYRCDAEIMEILPNNEFKVKYKDPADDIEKTKIVSDEFLRATDIELNTENASKYQDEDAINNILLEGVATFSELEHLAVIIHPWVDKYFFKPYLPKGFITFFMMTDSEMSIDTIIQTRDGYREYDYVSKYIALNILSYAGNKSNMSHKLNCIWCGVDDVLLKKITPRTRLLLGGVTYDRAISVLCDNCGFRFHRDDVIYSCVNDHHDVCIKCIWEKVKTFQDVLNALNEIDFYGIYQLNILPEIRNEIASYTCGKLLQFDK